MYLDTLQSVCIWTATHVLQSACILHYMCPHNAKMCPHIAARCIALAERGAPLSYLRGAPLAYLAERGAPLSYHYICVLILIYVSSYYCMRPHTTLNESTYCSTLYRSGREGGAASARVCGRRDTLGAGLVSVMPCFTSRFRET